MGTFSRLRVAILLVVLVIVTGVLGYRFLVDYPWFDALYMTIITLTTVGFLEVHPLSPTGRGFTMARLVAGLGIVLYTVVTLAESRSSQRLSLKSSVPCASAVAARITIAKTARARPMVPPP